MWKSNKDIPIGLFAGATGFTIMLSSGSFGVSTLNTVCMSSLNLYLIVPDGALP